MLSETKEFYYDYKWYCGFDSPAIFKNFQAIYKELHQPNIEIKVNKNI
mgnify:CR=1 FL=1